MNTSDFSTSFEKTSDTYPVYHVTSVSDLLRRLKALLFAVAFIVGAYSIADPSFAYFLKQTGTAAVMNAIEWVTPIASAQTRDSSGGITPASKMLLAQVTEKTKDEAQVSSTETVTYLNAAAENFFDIINRFIRITTTVRLGKEIRPLSGSVATQNLDLELVTPNANTQQNSIRGQLQNQIQNSNQNSNSGAKTIATGTTQAATVGTNTSRVSQVQQTEVPASLSQRIIERIIQPTGLSELQVRSIIDQSVNGLRSDLARLSSVPTTPVNYNYISPQVFGQAQRIDQLTNTIITSPTITNATVIGGTFAPTTINSTGNYAIGTGAGTANTLGSSTSTNTINGETIINNSLAIQGGTDYVTTGSQNDVDLGTASTVRYIGAGIATFTGLDNGADGKILILHNDSGSTLSLANEDVLSTAQNRIVTGSGAQLDLTTGKAVMLQYDASALRWRVVGGTGSGGPGNFTTLTTSDAVTLNDDMTFGDAITDTFTINSGEITTPNNLSFDTNTLFIDAANNSVGIGTNSPNSTLDVNGGVSFRAGANFTSTGALDDVNLGSNTMVRFDGAAPTTFSGIADGTDGKVIVLHNASSSVLTLNNDDTNSLAQNRIITGTGGSLALPSGSAVMLQYDSTLFVWRIIGASGTVGGSSFTTLTSSGNSTIGTGAGTNNTFGTGTGTTNTIGEVTGTNTINGTTTITDTISMNGDTIIGNTTSDRLLVTSHLLGSNALVFQGATDNASETTFTITDPTADRTITFKDGTGTVAFLSDTLSPVMTDNTADAYDLQEGSNNYLNITTTNASENISFGNATTNPTFSFLGSGLTTFTGATTTNGTATFNGNITQSGASTFSTGTGLATFNGNITQSGAGTVTTGTGLFTAGGAATITGLLTANGNITQSGAGTVTTGTGLFTAGGNATVTGNLTTTGTSTFTGSQTLVGNTDLQGTLADSTGNLTITDAVDVTGNITQTGTLTQTGSTTISSAAATSLTLTRSSVGQFLSFSDGTNTNGIYSVTATPEGSLTATVGSIAIDGTNGVLYLKVTGTGNTGWFATATGPTLYNADGTLSGNRIITAGTNTLTIDGAAADIVFNNGALTVGGTLAVTGNQTNTGDIALNGGDLTTTAATATLFNTNATNVSIAGAGTTVSIGAATGTTTINNATTAITGNTTVGGTLGVTGNQTNTGNITQTGATTFSTGTGAVSLNGDVTLASGKNFTQSGASTFSTGTGLATFNGNITQSGAGTVTTGTGLFTAGGNATVTGNLTTTGTSTFTGSQTLVGNTDLQGTLADSTGNLTITDAVDVTGNITQTGTLTQTGSTTISSAAATSLTLTRSSVGQFLSFSDGTNTNGIYSVTATPEGSLTATVGSIAIDGTNGVLYLKVTGTGNTGWFATATGPTLYNADGTLSGNRIITAGTNTLTIDGAAADIVFNNGALTVGGTLAVTGNQTNTGDIALNGGDLTTTAATATLFNTNATNVSIAGAGTTVSIGAATGTTTINNATTAITGNTTVGGTLGVTGNQTNTGNITQTGATTFSTGTGAVSLNGATSITGTNTLTVGTGATTLGGNLTTTGTSTFTGSQTLVGNTDLQGTLADSTGNLTITDAVDVTGNITQTGTLTQTGSTTISSAAATSLTLTRSSVGQFLSFSDGTNTNGIYSVTATPEGSLTATVGSIAIDGTNGVLYLKVTGAGNTGWFATATGPTLYNGDGTLSGNRIITAGTNTLTIDGTAADIVFNNGALTVGGTLAVTGNQTNTGDIALNGGDLTTTAATATLFNTNATNVSIAGAGTTVSIGAATGTTTINNATTAITGNTTVGGTLGVTGNQTNTGNITQTGATTFSTGTGAVSLNGDVTLASGKNFTQSGASTFSTGTGLATFNGNITQTGATTFSTGTGAVSLNGATSITGTNTLTVGTGATTLGGNLTTTGTSTFTGSQTLVGNTDLQGTLADSTGNLTITDAVDVTGNITQTGTLTQTGSTTISSAAATSLTLTRSSVGQFLSFSDGTNTNGIYSVTATPEGSLTATVGSIAIDGTNGVLYLKVTGTGNTGWFATATGPTLYNADGTLSGNRIITAGTNTLTIDGAAADIVFNNGALTVGGTLAVTGNQTNTGDIALNGGDLTTTAATATLFNTNATNVSIAGAGTTVSIGAATGTTTINNATTAITGNTTVGGTLGVTGNQTNTGNITQTGATTFSTGTGAVSLNGDVTLASGKNFTQSGASTFSTGTGLATFNGNITQSGAGTVTTGTGLFTAGGAATITGLLTANGNITQSGAGTVTTGTGAVTLNGATSITGTNTLTVGTGATTLGGALSSAGNTTLATGASTTNTFGTGTGATNTIGEATGTTTLNGSVFFTNLPSLPLNSGLLFVGNASNVAAAVALSGDATITNAGVLTIANDAVTTAKILDSNVTLAKLASDSVNSAKIVDGSVANADLVNSSVTVLMGTSGSDTNISGSPVSLGGSVTVNIPDAGAAARGVITTGSQTIAGAKTFSGNTTVSGSITANGDVTIGNATTDRLTITSHLLGSNALVFQGATDNASETTFTITDPTADRTITFKDGTGTVAFLSDTLSPVMTDNTADAYDLQEGSNNYLNITTTNASENISFGNATTNPTFSFLGSGAVSIAGVLDSTGNFSVNTNKFQVDASTGNTTVGGTLGVTGNQTNTGNITQTGATTFSTGTGAVSLNGDVTLASGKNFTQSGASTFSTGTGLATFNGNITQSGAGTVTTGTGLFTAGGAATITGLLTANGNITQSGAGTVTTGTGAVTLNGATSITGTNTLTVGTGATTLGGALSSAGNTTLATGASTTNTFGTGTGATNTIGEATGTTTLNGSVFFTNLPSLPLNSGLLFVGNASNVAAAVALSGDATITNAGVLTIANDAVTTAKIINDAVTLGTKTSGNYVANVASGTGITGGSAGSEGASLTLALDITGISSLAGSIDATDEVAIYDTSSGTIRKVTRSDFLSGLTGALVYQGSWDASTNTPTLVDGVGSGGQFYIVATAGVQDLGSGSISFAEGDWAVYNSTLNAWEKIVNSTAVSSVFGRTGSVTSQNGDYTASQITNVATGTIAAVTVQAALNELDSEKLINTLASGSLFIGNGSNIATAVALSGDATITNAGVLTIANDAVTTAKILDSNVTLAKLASDSVNSAKIVDGTVSLVDLNTDSVNSAKVVDGSIANVDLANSSITLATGTTGTDVNISGSPVSLGGTVTLNIPDASATNRGLVTTGAQTLAGNKTFSGASTTIGDATTDRVTLAAQVSGASPLVFQGNTDDAHTLTFAITDPTASQTLTFRDLSGTVALLSDVLAPTLTDNVSNSFDLQEGTNNYFNINTTNASENISFGNTTTNPTFSFLGSGLTTFTGATTTNGAATFNGNITQSGAGTVTTGTGLFTAGGAATITGLLTANGNITQSGAGTVTTGTGAVTLNGATSITGTNTLTVGTGATTLGGTLAVTGNQTNTGDIALNGGDLTTTSTTGTLFNTTATTVNIAGAATTIGLGAAGATVTGGGALTINSGTATALTLDSGTTGTVNLGTSANAKTVNIGTGAAVANTINVGGTGANTIAIGNTQTAGSIALGAAMTTGTITIGGTGAQTGTIGIGTGTGAQTVNLATGGTGSKTINIGTGAVANTLTIGNTTGATAVTINSGTGTINIGTGAQARTTNIANGAAAQTVVLGSTNTTSTTTINSGTGGLTFTTGAATNATTTLGTTGSAVFGSSTANTDTILIKPQTTTATASFGGTITSTDLTAARTWTFPDTTGTVMLTTGGLGLNQLTAATATNSINNGNFAQTWNWQLTGATNGLNLTENAASTGTGYIASIGTIAASTAKPFRVTALGSTILDTDSSGNITIASNITQSGATTFSTGTGLATFNGNITQSGAGTVTTGTGLFTAGGNATVTGNLTTTGTSTFTGSQTLVGNTDLQGTLADSTGNLTITDAVDVTGNITQTGTLTQTGSTTISSAAATSLTLTRSSVGQFLSFSDGTNTNGIYSVTATPEGSLTATVGSIAIDGTNGVLYLKVTGTGNTGWFATATGPTLYNADGTLSGNRIITAGTNTLTIDGAAADIVFNNGALTVGGTLAVTGNQTNTGDIALNGGDLTTTAATATLFNTNATNVSIAGAGTTVSIGAATGTTTINNATTAITGNTTVGGTLGVTGNQTNTGNITQTGATTFSTGTGAVSLNGDVTLASGKNFTQSGASTFSTGTGLATFNGNITQSGAGTTTTGTGLFTAGGNATVTGNLTTTGTSTLTGSQTLVGNTDLQGTLADSTGNLTITDAVDVTGNITQTGTLTQTGSTTISSAAATSLTLTRSSVGQFLSFSDGTNTNGIYSVTATPEGSLTAAVGSIAIDGTNGVLYLKVTGAGNTGWFATATGPTLYNGDGTLSGNRIITAGTNTLTIDGTAADIVFNNGALTVGGTLAVTGNQTNTADLALNGGDLTTTSATATLFNTNATNVSIAGAGTTVSIGAATGTTTINNATTAITGNATVGGTLGVTGNQTNTGNITQTGATTFSTGTGAVSLNGDVTLASGKNLTQSGASTFSTGTGLATFNGNITQSGAGTTTTGTGLFTAGGAATVTGTTSLNGDTTIGNASTDRVTITSQILGASSMTFQGATDNANSLTFVITEPTAVQTLTFRDESGTVALLSDILSPNLADNVTDSLDFDENGNDYINVNTTNGSENITLGNATTNPSFTFAGTGTATHTGDIALNGGDLTTTSTTGTLFNTNATTVNIAGAATTIGLGAAGATVTGGGALTINSGTATALTLDSGTTGTVNLGTSANAKTVNIGTGAAVANTINVGGTGGNTIGIGNTQTAGSVNVGAAMTTGTITIGGTGAQTGTIGIGTGTGAQTVNLATGGTGSKTINIGTGAVANTLTIGNTTGATAVTINSGTGTINIGTGAQARTTNIANGAAAQTVVLGSTNTTSTTTINAGTGGLTFTTGAATNATTTLGTTGSAVFGSSTANTDTILIKPQTTTATATFGGTITSADLTAARTWTFPDTTGTVMLTTGGLGLNQLTAATATNSINNGNFAQTWNWQLTGATNGLNLTENAASTGTGYIASIGTIAASTAKPFRVTALGSTILDTDSSGNITIASNITQSGATTFSTGTGLATFNGNITQSGAGTTTTGTGLFTAGGAATITGLLTANGNITQSGAGTVTTGTGAVTLNGATSITGTNTLTVGTGATTLGGTLAVTGNQTNTADLALNGGDLTTTSTTGTLFNTNATTVNIAGAATTIGLGAAGATVTGGGALTINSGTATALTLDSGTTGTVNLGTSANAKTVNIGTGAAVANTINVGGTGGNTIGIGNTQTAGSVNVGAAMTTGTITIGGTGAQTGTIGIGTGTGAQTVNLATGGTGSKTINIGTGAVANTLTIGNTTGATAVTIDSGTGAINIGTGAQARTTNIATGTAAQTVIIGSTNTTSGLTFNWGTSGGVFTLTDNDTDQLDIQEGTNNYININTTNAAENITLGNATTNPSFTFAGTGTATHTGDIALNGGDLTTTSTTGTLFNTNATTVNIAGAGTTVAVGAATGTTAVNNSLTVGGYTQMKAQSVSNVAGGGNIGTAAATVDVASVFNINQTTADQTLTLPSPTNTTAGKIVYVNNVGTVEFIMSGTRVRTTTGRQFVWNGSAWSPIGDDEGATTIEVVKSANESVILSTTFQDDDELLFAVGANETWIFQFDVMALNNTAPDIKFTITGPTGATCMFSAEDYENSTSVGNLGCGNSSGNFNGSGANEHYVVTGTVETAGTAGNVTLRWAQQNSSVTASTVRLGSHLVAHRVRGADLAEVYFTEAENVSPGTVVARVGNTVSQVDRATAESSANILGVISTEPGQIIGAADGYGKPVFVALSGRIPVKVTGPVAEGDLLAVSNINGVAQTATKSGYVIGTALTRFDPINGEQGEVYMFANVHYANIESDIATDDVENQTQLSRIQFVAAHVDMSITWLRMFAQSIVDMFESIAESISLIQTDIQTLKDENENLKKRIEILETHNGISTPEPIPESNSGQGSSGVGDEEAGEETVTTGVDVVDNIDSETEAVSVDENPITIPEENPADNSETQESEQDSNPSGSDAGGVSPEPTSESGDVTGQIE